MKLCMTFCGLSTLLAGSVNSAPLSSQDIFSKWSKAVVTIETPTGTGTGFFDNHGLLYTAYHVMDGADGATVTFSDGRKCKVLGAFVANKTKDYAVLRSESNVVGPSLGDYVALQPGERLTVIGSPLGLSQTVTEGIVSAKRTEGDVRLLQLSAGISPGSSGSPVFNANGEVVGLVVSMRTDGQLLNFAIASAELDVGAGVPLGVAFGGSGHSASGSGSLLGRDDDPKMMELLRKGASGYVGLKAVKVSVIEIPEALREDVTAEEIREWLTDDLTNGGVKVIAREDGGRLASAGPKSTAEIERLRWCDSFYSTVSFGLAAVKESDGTRAYSWTLNLMRAGVVLPGWIDLVAVDNQSGVGVLGSALSARAYIHHLVDEQAAQMVARVRAANHPE